MADSIYSIGVISSVKNKMVTDIRQLSWDELASLLTFHIPRGEKNGSAWLPGITTAGPRSHKRATPWTLLPLDIEQKNAGPQPLSVNDLTVVLQNLGVRCAVATSYSHHPIAPRYRVIFPLSRSLKFDEIKPLACAVAEMIGCSECFDQATTDPARAFYLPSCPLDKTGFSESKVLDGSILDVDKLLGLNNLIPIDTIEKPNDSIKNEEIDSHFDNPEKLGWTARNADYILNFLDPDSDYQEWFKIIAAIHYELGAESGYGVALEWSAKGRKFLGEKDFNSHWFSLGKSSGRKYVTGSYLIKTAFPDGVPKRTIIGNARRIKQYYLNRLMRVAETNQWYWWNGSFWEKITESEANDKGRLVIEEMPKEAFLHSDREEYLRWCNRSAQRGWIAAMQTLGDMPGVLVRANSLDSHAHLLGVTNGMIDLRTGTLLASDSSFRITNSAGVEYLPNSKCQNFEKTISDVFYDDPEMIGFLRRALGYSILANPKEEKIFMPYGNGANGKSKIFGAVMDALGDYAKNCSSETLLDSSSYGSSAGKPREDIVRLKGARMILASEPEDGAYLREALVKSMTGGDKITARTVYGKESVEIYPTWTTWMPTNHKPIVKGNDYGIWRRICLIPFERDMINDPNIKHDPNLAEKLRAERPGILAYLVHAAIEYQKIGLCVPGKIMEATEKYREDMDITAEWIEECCEVGFQNEAACSDLWQSWRIFAEERGLLRLIPTAVALGRRLQPKFPLVRRSMGKRYRVGISLRQPIDQLFPVGNSLDGQGGGTN